METYYSVKCPKCNSHNLFYNGDESDLTRSDVDGVRCWNCKLVFSLEENKIVSEDELSWVEDGKRND